MRRGIPEITPQELSEKIKSDVDFILLDVREQWEVDRVKIDDSRLIVLPLSQLARQLTAALPEAMSNDAFVDVVVYCHHGVRSADVTAWLMQNGFQNVISLRGGVDAYALEVDPTVGRY